MRGKVVSGVSRIAREGGARVAVIAGRVDLPSRLWRDLGIEVALACTPADVDLQAACERCEQRLSETVRRFVAEHLRG
jgi:glycerate kinase